jgi:Tol biopolymer transport system component
MTNTIDNDNHPVWSPDASRIAFIRSQTSAPRHYSIASISRSELAGRIEILVSGFSNIAYLSWSPDGTQLLFHGRESGMSQYAVYKVNADGSQLTNLSLVNNAIYREIEDMFPAWSPDGSQIAFTRSAHFTQSGVDINARGMLFKMKNDGTDKARVTDQEFTHTTSWRPKDIFCL